MDRSRYTHINTTVIHSHFFLNATIVASTPVQRSHDLPSHHKLIACLHMAERHENGPSSQHLCTGARKPHNTTQYHTSDILVRHKTSRSVLPSQHTKPPTWCGAIAILQQARCSYLRIAAVCSSSGMSDGGAISTGGNSSAAPSGVSNAPPRTTASINLHSCVGTPSRAG